MSAPSIRQKILLAATECAERFSAEALVLRAWELHPESFSLAGTSHAHPDSSRVLAKFLGRDGAIGLGWVERVGTNTYRVTREGLKLAKKLRAERPVLAALAPVDATARRTETRLPRSLAEVSARVAARVELNADIDAVCALAKCDALRAFLRGTPLTFADARSFWGLSDSADAKARIAEIDALLTRTVTRFNRGPVDPRLPPLATCYALFNLHGLLRVRFARELDALSTATTGGASP